MDPSAFDFLDPEWDHLPRHDWASMVMADHRAMTYMTPLARKVFNWVIESEAGCAVVCPVYVGSICMRELSLAFKRRGIAHEVGHHTIYAKVNGPSVRVVFVQAEEWVTRFGHLKVFR